MSSCKPEIIYEGKSFVLTQCRDCGRLGMLYGQCMLSFDEHSLGAFLKYMRRLDFEREKLRFYDGRDRVVIETYHPDVQFCLEEDEFYRLKAFLLEGENQYEFLNLIRSL